MKNNTITVEELQKLLNNEEPVYVLDVRPADQYEEWNIAESVNADVSQKLKNNDEKAMEGVELPETLPIVTVCAEGKTSQVAAEQLRKKGLSARSLEGGMKAWNFAWNTSEMALPDSDIRIVQVRRTAKACLSYVIGSKNESIVIDAALDPEVYLKIAEENRWTIRYVMDTHIHADYLSRTRELADASGAEHLFIDIANVEYSFKPFKDNEELTFGNAALKIMHTPGHTRESVSFLVQNKALFTGDTLFTDGVGRPDLISDKSESERKSSHLFDSLQRIMKLPADTVVLPAHVSVSVPFDNKMISARIDELQNNLKLLRLSKEQFIKETLKKIPPTPENHLIIAELNKKGNFEGYQPADLEAGANRCAVS